MFGRKPVFDRLLVQKAGHVFDLSARAVAYDLPIPFGDLYGFENDGRVAHPANMSLRRAHSSRIAGEKKK